MRSLVILFTVTTIYYCMYEMGVSTTLLLIVGLPFYFAYGLLGLMYLLVFLAKLISDKNK